MDESPRQGRRRDDALLQDNVRRIDDLISQSHDPVQQATLLVLSKINISLNSTNSALDSNTRATEQIATELTTHRKDFALHDVEELKRMSWIRGAWWSMVGLIAVVVGLGVFMVQRHIGSSDKLSSEMMELTMRVKLLEHINKVDLDK